jgi:hypothetical protein
VRDVAVALLESASARRSALNRACDECGTPLIVHRRGARFCDDSCKNAWHNRQRRNSDASPSKRLEDGRVDDTHAIRAIRDQHEDAKAHWSLVVDEAIVRHFKADPSGVFHADDLESLGIPDDHRNVIGSQIAKWVNRRRMVECGRRASAVPSRNGAKSNEYRLTERGARLIAGLDTENPEGTAVECAAPSTGRSRSCLSGGIPGGAGSSLSVQSGEGRGDGSAGAGQAKVSGQRARSTSLPAGTGSPDLHEGHLPATSPYSGENEYA